MPHKDPNSVKRKTGKDKKIERKKRNGNYSAKHIRNQTSNNLSNSQR